MNASTVHPIPVTASLPLWSRGLLAVLAAQFLSAMADNALLFGALALLRNDHFPAWTAPLLQEFFVGAYIVLAPFVGPFADCKPKGTVMLVANGVKFIGAPNQSDANSPTNDPNYIKSLSTCAAKSNILAALKNQQSYSDNLTPAQIEQQNKGYLAWRDCMIGRGWGIPEPKPDEKGRLFSFSGAQNGQGPNFKPPPGQDILSSSDISECASEAQQKVPQNSGG